MHLTRWLAGTAVAATLAAVPAAAHHSFAAFDYQQTRVMSGTVKEFQWTNPHVWIELYVPGVGGNITQWSIGAPAPSVLTRQGWHRDTMKPGDRAVVTIHPLKDGTTGGSLVSASVNGVLIKP